MLNYQFKDFNAVYIPTGQLCHIGYFKKRGNRKLAIVRFSQNTFTFVDRVQKNLRFNPLPKAS